MKWNGQNNDSRSSVHIKHFLCSNVASSEEIVEDLRANMHAIQENEYNQLHELTALIDIEFNFVQTYLQVLKDVRAEWKDR